MKRPDCEQAAELLQRFIEAQRMGERVPAAVLEQAEDAVIALLQPVSREEITELCALGSAMGGAVLQQVAEAAAAN